MLKPLLISPARSIFEIGDQGFVKDERAYKQLAMVIQTLQVTGDPEFLVLFWSSRIVFNKANNRPSGVWTSIPAPIKRMAWSILPP
jgi:hypothetical protein